MGRPAHRSRVRCRAVAILLAAALAQTASAAAPTTSATASGATPAWPPASWLEPTEPFLVVDGIYYVGSAGLSAFLITTPEGHILLDGGLPGNAPQIAASIERLGFALTDVKILLNSHAHFDHSGGLAELKARTGAQFYAHEGDVSALEGGFYLGSESVQEYAAPPVKVDRALAEGAVVELGGRRLVLHHTPGHSRGCSSWGLAAKAGNEDLDVLVFCSATVAANRLVGPPQYEGVVEDYRATFAKARQLPVDVPLAPHPEMFALLEKRERAAAGEGYRAFVDPEAFDTYMERLSADFERQLAEQTAKLH
jgi:metallo-beta-lactamase class B